MRVSLCLLVIQIPLLSAQRGVRRQRPSQRRHLPKDSDEQNTPPDSDLVVDSAEDVDPGTPPLFGLGLLPAAGGDANEAAGGEEEEGPPATDPFLGFVADALAGELGGAIGEALGDPELGEYFGDQLGDILSTPEGQQVFGDVLNNPLLGDVLESDLFGDALIEYLIQVQLENAVASSGGTTTEDGQVIFSDANDEETGDGGSLGISDMPSLSPSDMPSDVPSAAPSTIMLPTIGGARRAQRRRALKENDEGAKPEMGSPKTFFELVGAAEKAKTSKGVESDGIDFIEAAFSSDAPSIVPSDAPSIVPSDAPSTVPSAVPSSVPAPTLIVGMPRQKRRRLKESDEGTKLVRAGAPKKRRLKGSKSAIGAQIKSVGLDQTSIESGSGSAKGDNYEVAATSDAYTIEGDSIATVPISAGLDQTSIESGSGSADNDEVAATSDAYTIEGNSIATVPTIAPSFSAMPTISNTPTSSAVPTFSVAPIASESPSFSAAPSASESPSFSVAPSAIELPSFSVAPSDSKLPTLAPVSAKAPKKEKSDKRRLQEKKVAPAGAPAGPPLVGTESVSSESADDGPEASSMMVEFIKQGSIDKRLLKESKGATAGAPVGGPPDGMESVSSKSADHGPRALNLITDFIEQASMWADSLMNGDSSGAATFSDEPSLVPSDAPSMVPSDAPSSMPSLAPSPTSGRRRLLKKGRSE